MHQESTARVNELIAKEVFGALCGGSYWLRVCLLIPVFVG